MKINYTVAQQFIARVLLISLCLQSCGGGFNNNPLISTGEEQTASVQTNTQAIIPLIDIHPLIDQTLIAQEGHLVTFYTIEDELLASVRLVDEKDELHIGVPVEVKKGAVIASLVHLPKNVQKTRICVQLAQGKQPTKVVIYQEVDLIGDGKWKDSNINKSGASSSDDVERKSSYKEEWGNSRHRQAQKDQQTPQLTDDRQVKKQEHGQLTEQTKYESEEERKDVPCKNVDGLPAHFTYSKAIEVLQSNCANIKKINLSQEKLDRAQLTKLAEALKNNFVVGHIILGEVPSDCQELKKDIEEKLVQNICNYRYHPSDYVHGLLASHVYKDPKKGDEVDLNAYCDEENEKLRKQLNVSTLPEEKELKKLPNFLSIKWKVVNATDDINRSGYYSAMYVNEATHQAVLAFQGTHEERLVKDLLIEDLQGVAGNKVTRQQSLSEGDTIAAARHAEERGLSLSMTGHSLGGYLAELSVGYYYSNNNCIKPKKAKYYENNIVGVVFDSPGATRKLDSFKIPKEGLPITTYLSTPNIVNMCDEHLPDMYTIFPNLKEWLAMYKAWNEEKSQSKIVSSVNDDISVIVKAIKSLYESHSLTTILGAFDAESGKPKKYVRMARWPSFNIEKRIDSISTKLENGIDWITGYMVEKYLWPPLKSYLNPEIQDIVTAGHGLITLSKDYGIDIEQPFTALKYLGPDFKEPSDLPDEHKFLLRYQGGYDVSDLALNEHPVNSNDINNDCYNIDCLLYKLHQHREVINQSPYSSIGVSTLQSILKEFEVQGTKPHFILTDTHLSIRDLRSKMQRALEVFSAARIDKLIEESKSKNRKRIYTIYSKIAQENLKKIKEYYMPRKEQEEAIDKQLANQGIAVLHGPGGCGKSSVVAKYAEDKKNSQAIWWLQADTQEKLEESYKGRARELLDEKEYQQLDERLKQDPSTSFEELSRKVYNILEDSKEPVTIILDEAKDPMLIDLCLLYRPASVKVIITTRNDIDFNKLKYGPVKFNVFTDEEAKIYVSKRLQLLPNDTNVEALIRAVGKIPLILDIATSYINVMRGMTVVEYIIKLEALKKSEKKQAGRLVLPEVELGFKTLDVSSQTLLRYIAYMDSDFIPITLVRDLLNIDDTEEINHILDSLERLSLITVVNDNNVFKQVISLHKDIQEQCKVYTDWIDFNNLPEQDLVKSLLVVLEKRMPDASLSITSVHAYASRLLYEFGYAPTVSSVLKAAQEKGLLENLAQNSSSNSPLTNLYLKIGHHYYHYARNYAKALEYYLKANEIIKCNHPARANLFLNMGSSYYNLKEYHRAVEFLNEAVNLKASLSDYQVASLFYEIGDSYLEIEDYVNATSNLKRSLTMYDNIYQSTRSKIPFFHPYIVEILNPLLIKYDILHICNVYNKLVTAAILSKRNVEALQYYKQAIELAQDYESIMSSPIIKDINNTINQLQQQENINLSSELVCYKDKVGEMRWYYEPVIVTPDPIPSSSTNPASKNQILWDDVTSWVKTLIKWYKTDGIESHDVHNTYKKELLMLKDNCKCLVQESATVTEDKWYVYSLEDMLTDIDEALREGKEIDNGTIKHFKKRLSGIKKDFIETDTYLDRPNIPYSLGIGPLKPAELLFPEMSMLNHVGGHMPALTQ